MADSSFSDYNLLYFLIFLNTRINKENKTFFSIHSRNREVWENKYEIKFQGSIDIYLDFLTEKEILKYNLIRSTSDVGVSDSELSEKKIFRGCIGTIYIDKYQSFFVAIINKIEDERKMLSNKLIETDGKFQQAKEKLVSCEYKLTEAEAYIKKTEDSIKKAQDEKIELLGFSPLENNKKIQKTKKEVQDFLEVAKENNNLIGFVSDISELIKNIESIEKVNDNYTHVYKNIIKPMKDETDKSIKEITDQSKKGTTESIKAINNQSLKGTIITVIVAILSIVITFIMQNYHFV